MKSHPRYPGGRSFPRTFDPHRNLIAAITNSWNGAPLATFDYANDSLARRTRRVDNSAVTNDFGYNLRSEVTSAAMGTNAYSYAFDSIGNRQSASRLEAAAAVTNLYASNPLNQYTNILCAPAPLREASPTYDDDGNMTFLPSTSGGGAGGEGWLCQWDAENRLIRADDGSNVIVYAYDFMSRRISRTAYRRIAENAYETLDSRSFLYDGWNPVSERITDNGSPITNLYTWGLDLSGTLQGAGGIGGLVAASLNGTNVFYSFDGNGNVTDLTDANGTLAAHYEYDPFGRMIASTGTLATANSFRFSTKHWDDATGLGYWGYRYYHPDMGRWLSRDLIGERGGANLSMWCINSGGHYQDADGLVPSRWGTGSYDSWSDWSWVDGTQKRESWSEGSSEGYDDLFGPRPSFLPFGPSLGTEKWRNDELRLPILIKMEICRCSCGSDGKAAMPCGWKPQGETQSNILLQKRTVKKAYWSRRAAAGYLFETIRDSTYDKALSVLITALLAELGLPPVPNLPDFELMSACMDYVAVPEGYHEEVPNSGEYWKLLSIEHDPRSAFSPRETHIMPCIQPIDEGNSEALVIPQGEASWFQGDWSAPGFSHD